MKNIYILILFIVVAFTNPVKAQYPIPSYDVSVYGKATFEENDRQQLSSEGSRRTRQLIVHTTIVHMNASSPDILVWIYSLDGQNRYGPFTVSNNYITFEIDFRQWGVLIFSDEEILADVWIE